MQYRSDWADACKASSDPATRADLFHDERAQTYADDDDHLDVEPPFMLVHLDALEENSVEGISSLNLSQYLLSESYSTSSLAPEGRMTIHRIESGTFAATRVSSLGIVEMITRKVGQKSSDSTEADISSGQVEALGTAGVKFGLEILNELNASGDVRVSLSLYSDVQSTWTANPRGKRVDDSDFPAETIVSPPATELKVRQYDHDPEDIRDSLTPIDGLWGHLGYSNCPYYGPSGWGPTDSIASFRDPIVHPNNHRSQQTLVLRWRVNRPFGRPRPRPASTNIRLRF